MKIQNIIGNNLLLFAVNIWIKKPQVVNIQNNFLGIISHHTFLKEALIIIKDISIFLLHGLWAVRVWNTKEKIGFQSASNFLRFLNFYLSSLWFTSREHLKY